MKNPDPSEEEQCESCVYEIRIKGHLNDRWAPRFEGMEITLKENGDTLLTGPVVDQAALHGLLKTVRDAGMPLISVCSVAPLQKKNSPQIATDD